MQARYSRWDDTQDPFGPELSAGELLEELSDDALSGLGIEGALSRLLRRGMRGSFDGLDALRARLRERRARANVAPAQPVPRPVVSARRDRPNEMNDAMANGIHGLERNGSSLPRTWPIAKTASGPNP